MFNCRNNLTFKAFLPFLPLKLGRGDLAMESLGTGAQGGGKGGDARGGARFFFAFCPFSFYPFCPFCLLLFLPFLPFTSRYRPRK